MQFRTSTISLIKEKIFLLRIKVSAEVLFLLFAPLLWSIISQVKVTGEGEPFPAENEKRSEKAQAQDHVIHPTHPQWAFTLIFNSFLFLTTS